MDDRLNFAVYLGLVTLYKRGLFLHKSNKARLTSDLCIVRKEEAESEAQYS